MTLICLLDIGNHIISDRGYRKPDTYAEVFEILSEEKVIPKNLLYDLEGMAAFRNVLVHDYLKIDHDKVYAVLHERLPYLEKLAVVFDKFI